MTPAQFESIKRYVGFDAASSARLRAFYPIARPHLGAIVTDFYDAIRAHPHAEAAITGGDAQVERLKRSLTLWLTELLEGPHDDAYLEKHSRIGRVHVRIDLPQEYMFTAVNRIRSQLLSVAESDAAVPAEERSSLTATIDRILDLELAVMLDTYRENLLEAVRVGERLSVLGQLSATIAHELRNPLGVIESSLFLVQKQLEKLGVSDPTLDKHTERISNQVDSCGATIRNMLDLARDRPLSVRMAHVRALLEGAIGAAAPPEGVFVELVGAEDQTFEVDPDQLAKAVSNLLSNALHAVGSKGHIRVEVQQHAEQTWILVADDGPGMNNELRGRAFEALFTTKESGAGLGLPVARRIAQLHGGDLEFVSTEHGACFRISVPTRSRATLPESR